MARLGRAGRYPEHNVIQRMNVEKKVHAKDTILKDVDANHPGVVGERF